MTKNRLQEFKIISVPIIIGGYIILALCLSNLWVFISMSILLFALGISVEDEDIEAL
jgi:hypothetical protein